VGLSAIQIAVAAGALVVAVDILPGALELASALGAAAVVDARTTSDVPAAVRELTAGGAVLSLDALGSAATCVGSVLSLRPRGRHVQVGLLPPSQGRPLVPMERVVALELELLGSHGMAAHAYPELLALVGSGRLRPDVLVTKRISLDEAATALAEVGQAPGITVITSF
jgi:alcohol dehydrogenase